MTEATVSPEDASNPITELFDDVAIAIGLVLREGSVADDSMWALMRRLEDLREAALAHTTRRQLQVSERIHPAVQVFLSGKRVAT
jgi:hypothetical protein